MHHCRLKMDHSGSYVDCARLAFGTKQVKAAKKSPFLGGEKWDWFLDKWVAE